jgi:HEPN domain-containing protein
VNHINEQVSFWLKSAAYDWRVSKQLFEKKSYAHSLFFAHLVLEKHLKACFVKKNRETAPYKHNLVLLAEKCKLSLSEDQEKLLEEVSDFNLEARYPDYKFSFKKKCTAAFTRRYLTEIGVFLKWLKKEHLLKK